MPWAVAGAIGGALISANASKKAAQTQANAATQSNNLQAEALEAERALQEKQYNANLALQERMYDNTGQVQREQFDRNAALQREMYGNTVNQQRSTYDTNAGLQQANFARTQAGNAPFATGGTQAFSALLDRLGISGNTSAEGYGSFGKPPSAQDVMNEPGYQFGLQQGQLAQERIANAKGMTYSGAQLKAADRYANDYATTRYGDSFNRLQQANQQVYNQMYGLAGMGQSSLNNTNAAGLAQASNTGNYGTNMANQIGAAGASMANGTGMAGQNMANTISQAGNSFANAVGASGANMANQLGQAGSVYANNAGSNLQGAANANASNSLAQGNIWGNALNQGVSAYNNAPKSSAIGVGSGGNYQAYDQTNYNPYGYINGGP